MSVEKSAEYVPLLNYENDYEILNEYPFTIRRKNDKYELTEGIWSKSYPRVCLNGKSYLKHRLIALQFLPNPDNLPEIDHINRDTMDYHLSNLRWVNQSTNCRNKASNKNIEYEFVDEIPDDAIVVNDYGKHTFEDYYYYDNVFYFYNGIQYRKLHINERKKTGYLFVIMFDTEGKQVNVSYTKFKKLYDLM